MQNLLYQDDCTNNEKNDSFDDQDVEPVTIQEKIQSQFKFIRNKVDFMIKFQALNLAQMYFAILK
ncbi:hypothetical protein BpHYR1_026573 [Brachionus plicatilis]|uniref:Uncharacterized protein n=1 Tax=Brachionus plicatilis TaxID=10195 RepID=A0A3M7PF74_BRAPC|nr:hypothetical protein BpHYR1_026573 [Brachionus plicatilis]